MINLIPSAAKKSLKFEYWVRVFSVWLIIWAAILIIGATLMFPTYVLIGSQVSATAEEAESAEENVNNFNAVSRDLVLATQQARMAVDVLGNVKLSRYQDLLKQFEGQGVQIDSISITRSEEGIEPIVVTGVASSRIAFADYANRLEANDAFTEVDLPFSNVAQGVQGSEIEFSLTIIVNNEVSI
jgi:hypothetical protein